MIIKKYKLTKFFVIFGFYTLAAGMVHPVTPTFIESIGAPSSTFGIAFTGMALGQFIFSPLWGKLLDKLGYPKSICTGLIMYGISALIFYSSRHWYVIVIGRFIGGAGVGGILVPFMAYIMSLDAPSEDKNQLLVFYSSFQSIGTSLGYLIGGIAGDINLSYAFFIQSGTLFLSAIAAYIFIKNPTSFKQDTQKLKFSEVNPFTSISNSLKLINPTVGLFLVSVFLTMVASSGFDQNFNYFLRATFDFAPSSAGILKAVIAILSLTANLTINIWIVRNKNIATSMCLFISFASIGIIATMISTSLAITLVSSLIYYTSYAIYSPLQQTVMTKNSSDSISKGTVSGLFNASRSFGMVIGPLFAGLVFDTNPDIAFTCFAICFILAIFLAYLNYKKLLAQGVSFTSQKIK